MLGSSLLHVAVLNVFSKQGERWIFTIKSQKKLLPERCQVLKKEISEQAIGPFEHQAHS